MRIQFKRNNSSSSTLPTSSAVNAGEPLWFKDELYIGSVGTGAGGVETTAGTPVLAVRTKAIDTTSTTSLTPSASESLRGTGTLELHKIAKTGAYDDLVGAPAVTSVVIRDWTNS